LVPHTNGGTQTEGVENRVLREVRAGGLKRLHNEEFYDLYTPPNIIRAIKSRRMRWAGRAAHMGDMRNAYNILVRKPEGKRPHEKPRSRWKDNIRMDFTEI